MRTQQRTRETAQKKYTKLQVHRGYKSKLKDDGGLGDVAVNHTVVRPQYRHPSRVAYRPLPAARRLPSLVSYKPPVSRPTTNKYKYCTTTKLANSLHLYRASCTLHRVRDTNFFTPKVLDRPLIGSRTRSMGQEVSRGLI